MASIVLGSTTVISESGGAITANLDDTGITRYVIVKSSQDISGADQRSISYSSGPTWTDHMYTGNFTTQKVGDVEAFFSGGHGYESGAVRLQVLWELRDGNGIDVSSTYWKTSGGVSPAITSYGGETHGRVQNCFKQGFGYNASFGSNSNHIVFPNLAVGTYNLVVRVSNNYSSSTAIMNYFVGEQDILTVYHY